MRSIVSGRLYSRLAGLGQTTGCGSDKPAAVASPTPHLPAQHSAPTSNAAGAGRNRGYDPSSLVSGPIIVEHQVDLTAQRDGVVAKIFFDAPRV